MSLVASCLSGHSGGDYSHVALRGVSRKLTIRGGVSISHAPCLHRHVDIIDTIACSNRCMLTLYCLIGHSIVINDDESYRHWQLASRAVCIPLLEQKSRYNCTTREVKIHC